MFRTVALASSIVANAVLLVAWIGAAKPAAVPVEPIASVAATPSISTTDDFGRWLALGLDLDEARRLLFATHEAAALVALDNPWRRYWQSQDPALTHAEQLARIYASIRDDLGRQFGPDAASVPEFSRAFRPLDAQFEFLSSAEQVALQELRLRERAELSKYVGRCEPAGPQQGMRAVGPSAALDFLPPERAFEVLLRDSPRASQLRRSGVDLSEREFRRTFELLDRLDTNRALDVQLDTRRDLEALLGAQRWRAIAAARDPLYVVLERVAGVQGLDAATTAAAYAVLGEIQDEWLDLSVRGRLDEPAAVAAVTARELERLVAVTGESAAAAILAAREQFFRELSGPDTSRAVAK